jgi:aminoglycoside phosphotransferase (APT) family kinase protein
VSRPEVDQLRPVLGALLGSLKSIEPLAAGSGGVSHLVEAATGRFVAKVFAPEVPVLLGPAEQFALLHELAEAGIAPRPAGFDTAVGLLVTEIVADAEPVSAAELRRPERIHEVAGLLRVLHAVPTDVPPFAPAGYAARYLARLGGRARLSSADRRRYDELVELAGTSLSGPVGLCHNDLTADNLFLGAAPKLVDFDYAVTASPFVDLASVVFMNDFAPAEAKVLLEAYFDGEMPWPEAEFARVLRLLRLLAHFWSLASAHVAADIVARYRIADG